ncbi:Fungalysin/Thermolysin Extracellular metalloproteinase 5 [Serendipita sp. 399]|nr:Fungalysin/Thermolysin Extracellular metalloproteinase 5 [Serendipita sp. 399]
MQAFILSLAAGSALAFTPSFNARKSLSFGPVLPQAQFILNPAQPASSLASAATTGPYAEPQRIATLFVDDLTSKYAGEGHSYFIREDSYTDRASGVSHFYIRQLIQGIEVADGNINLNIHNGRVISYGDSFYRGQAPPEGISPESGRITHQATYCDQLRTEMFRPAYSHASGQTPLMARHQEQMSQIHESNCLIPEANLKAVKKSTDYSDPARAALTFMILATPNNEVSDDIAANFDTYLAGITYQTEHHFAGTSGNSGQLTFPVDFLHNVPGAVSPVRARLAYVQTPTEDGATELALVWKLEVEMENNWYEAAVRVADPSVIVEVVDWASDAGASPERLGGSYNVWKWGINDPDCGARSLEVAPYDEVASPLGWHSLPASKDARSRNKRFTGDLILNVTQTYGNNVYAHEDWAGRNDWLDNYRPDGGKDLVFDYSYKLKLKNGTWADPKSYINLTITQLFYTANMIHDIYYRYGFDEISGNFQQYNFEKGGKENDAVIANAQDGSGYNTDGQNGRMRMYTWNVHGFPYRDGDLEAGIVIHEYSHGLSTRLTGGPADSGCLGWGESGGMGEGWGDLIATIIRSTKDYKDYSMGSWAANETNGIRNYVYSTNITTNPSTYKTLDKGGYWGVHAIGEVWAEILWIVYNRLVTKHGFSKTLFPPVPDKYGKYPADNEFFRPITYDVETGNPHTRPIPKHGNTLMMQLVLDGMKLQPCRPGFMEARDAIVQADEILTGGENYCLIWEAFANRGLGTDATVTGRTPWGGGVRHDGHAVPKACRKAGD